MITIRDYKLDDIAFTIQEGWEKVSPHAEPYLEAMFSLKDMNSKFGLEDADDIVMRFLINAGGWRGPVAREVKAELNRRLKAHTASSRQNRCW